MINPLLFKNEPKGEVKKCRLQWKSFNIGYREMQVMKDTELSYADNMEMFEKTKETLKENVDIHID